MRFVFGSILVLCLLAGNSIPLSTQELSEYELKAGYVANFIKLAEFSTWPQIKRELVVCVFGNDETLGAFSTLSEKTIQRWTLRTESSPQSGRLELCDVVFLAKNYPTPYAPILISLAKRPVLTIGEAADFLEQGGMIRLFEEDNRIRFEISLERARSVGISFSSKLLSLAKVRGGK